jgi:hypothetical protein
VAGTISITGCRTPQAQIDLRHEISETRNSRTETFYRGELRILVVRTHDGGKVTRLFCRGDEVLFAESDDDADGIFECVSLEGRTPFTFERFIRKLDGTVEPMSTEQLIQERKEIRDLVGAGRTNSLSE